MAKNVSYWFLFNETLQWIKKTKTLLITKLRELEIPTTSQGNCMENKRKKNMNDLKYQNESTVCRPKTFYWYVP